MRNPYEVSEEELFGNLDDYVDAVFSQLESSMLVMPRGSGLVPFARFQEAYEHLKRVTQGFRRFTPDDVLTAMGEDSLVFVVLRTILAMTAPDWAYLATVERGARMSQSTARTLDRSVRVDRDYFRRLLKSSQAGRMRSVRAMVELACDYIVAGAPPGAEDTVHWMDRADTAEGLASLQRMAEIHVPYAVLLYERYLGRPFAGHRDAVSELVGEVMESAVEHRLVSAGITYRKTKRAERLPGFPQAPDFTIPTEYAPDAVIEAKLANDDGTARDKVTRILRLVQLSDERVVSGKPGFEVIACIDGRGFGVRREDMRQLIRAVKGKVFTLRTLDHLVPNTRLSRYAVPGGPS